MPAVEATPAAAAPAPAFTIAASILSADRLQLIEEMKRVVAAGVDAIHLNVIDSTERPNVTLGHLVCSSLRAECPVPIGVQIRASAVEALIDNFAEAGADLIAVHPGPGVEAVLRSIEAAGCKAGLAFDPAEPLELLTPWLDRIDLVHVSCAAPPPSARKFLDSQVKRVAQARQMIDGHRSAGGRAIRLQVDGDIHSDNIGRVAAAGADAFVIGRAIFGRPPYRDAVAALRAALPAGSSLRTAA